MTETKRSDPKLGKLIGDGEIAHRDAVHIAVIPVTANEDMEPGDHVGFKDGSADVVTARVDNKMLRGIVDPYLKRTVIRGARLWLFLYPGTITSLRHQWTHPDIPDDTALTPNEAMYGKLIELAAEEKERERVPRAKRWLMDFASEVGVTYHDLMNGLEYPDEGVMLSHTTPDVVYEKGKVEEMWRCYEEVTGKTVKAEDRKSHPFSCAC